MQDTTTRITERVPFEDKEKFTSFINRCIKVSTETSKSTYAIYDNVVFKVDLFYEGLKKILNQFPTEKRAALGIQTITIIFEELYLEVEKEDVFLYYQLKDLGKFKIKDHKLKEDLKILWKTHKEFELNDQEFAYSIKELMRKGIIDYRKGSINLKKSILVRYRNK